MLQNAYFLAKIGADTAEIELHLAEMLPIGRFDRLTRAAEREALRARREDAARRAEAERVAREEVPEGVGGAKLAFFGESFGNFSRVRSPLYQNEFLKENMRLTAFFKIYKICILLQRCNLKI